MNSQQHCFHCGEVVPEGFEQLVEIDGLARSMCCPGCAAAAHAIVSGGLSSYYTFRTEQAEKLQTADDDLLDEIRAYDLSEIQEEFVEPLDDGRVQALFTVDGIRCAACAWLIEKRLDEIEAVNAVDVNVSAHRIRLSWRPEKVKLSDLLLALRQVGYSAFPFKPHHEEQLYRNSYKNYLIRLGISGLATMQVMMFAVALYFGVFSGIDQQHEFFLRTVSLLMATPVILYAAFPFYQNALKGLLSRQLNMDIPVSIALLLAYAASAYATFSRQGEVYFESVSMFAFFLLLGRFLEMNARRKASEHSSNLLKLLPSKANLIGDDGIRVIAAARLCQGEKILIKPGEHIPVDCEIFEGNSDFDESMLTGESLPQTKGVGDVIYGGATNGQHPVRALVLRSRASSLANSILKLQDEALQQKPRLVQISDLLSRWFVALQLLIALSTYLVWLQISPDDALWITLAVLVATCPCALALATPTALTCAASQFGRMGLLVRRAGFIESLPKASAFVFDKTGTLTEGVLTIEQVQRLRDDDADYLAIAAALETNSQHPIALAFAKQAADDTGYRASEIRSITGAGLTGKVNGHEYRLGSADFVGAGEVKDEPGMVSIFLADEEGTCCRFVLSDVLRDETPALIKWLRRCGHTTHVLSGDPSSGSRALLSKLKFDSVETGLKPEQKLQQLRQIQRQQRVVACGDGINDAPLLAAADLSIAMGSGSDLAKISADAVIPGNRLGVLGNAIRLAGRTRVIIKQNLAWALGYNAVIIPLAVTGHIAPYFAALGMSLSSLIVVSNSLRLLK